MKSRNWIIYPEMKIVGVREKKLETPWEIFRISELEGGQGGENDDQEYLAAGRGSDFNANYYQEAETTGIFFM